ncbi:DUF6924 domain-containing protein [Streptomyces cinereoruber]|uniref:DUF6924 domain-containing protein n=1 Tax=Streptomyces cinereoruber TaxID=67260 RepID=UPI003632BE77
MGFLPRWTTTHTWIPSSSPAATRCGRRRGLPALTTIREDEDGLGPVSHQELIEPPEFRAAPAAVHSVRANVTLGTMDFAEFAAAASAESDRVLRSI